METKEVQRGCVAGENESVFNSAQTVPNRKKSNLLDYGEEPANYRQVSDVMQKKENIWQSNCIVSDSHLLKQIMVLVSLIRCSINHS